MSTLTQAQPGTAVPARLLTVPLAVTFLAEFTSLTSFFLLLSVMPMLAAAAGAGSSGAGLITGSLLLGTMGGGAPAGRGSAALRIASSSSTAEVASSSSTAEAAEASVEQQGTDRELRAQQATVNHQADHSREVRRVQ